MSQVYCTATLELNQFTLPAEVVHYLRETGLEATYEDDVVFIGSNYEGDNDTLMFVAQRLIPFLYTDHEDIVFDVTAEDPLESYEIVIRNKSIYTKKAIKIF